ncbi:inner membrane protein YhjD [Pantoea sp. Aalb]|uniref:inner membrane protein YhjD n=1 Tax=Pantoea sp. Aalb TaxID=2576762 RepID=UPI001328025C|nr:inner membrane protein YhjD [Pantoea sp. Aalb]MXP67144.1 inner membrane protein YhjD [Pantoea sp. Aalb]
MQKEKFLEKKNFVNIKTRNKVINKIVNYIFNFTFWSYTIPIVTHFLNALERFNNRFGKQFGAAITYFSFLSLIPMLMLFFAIFGYMLSLDNKLLTCLIEENLNNINNPTLDKIFRNSINTAIQQHTTIGITGLLIAFYSGINWISNLREAVCTQSSDFFEFKKYHQKTFWKRYLIDCMSLIVLILALIMTVALTSIAGSAKLLIINILKLENIKWLPLVITIISLSISIFINYLLFLWIFWVLPYHKPHKKALFRGTLLATIGFEVVKLILSLVLPKLMTSPSGIAFGSVLGLMAFFYFFACLTLFCAAWIATAKYV